MTFDYMKYVSEVQTEMNMNWAEANPELFTKKVREFMKTYDEEGWNISLKRRKDYAFILVANRKEK